jgi:hypothetical protein
MRNFEVIKKTRHNYIAEGATSGILVREKCSELCAPDRELILKI